MTESEHNLTFKPLTPQTWSDFETLFGRSGAYGGCWCMWWRSTRKEFEQRGNDGNKSAMRAIVQSGQPTGILAYQGEIPVGWCSIAPRETYGSLERSPVLRRIDDQSVWSLVCFFVAKEFRRQGIAESLVRGAIEHVAEQGGRIIEAYPTVSSKNKLPPVSSFMGVPDLFLKAGFKEVARPSKSRMIVRYEIRST
jgi:ribosomal protein S18 acetylase RimI-like enzyme